MHYYLYEFGTEEGDTGACIVEIYSDSAQSPGPEFEEITLDELHARGYLSHDELWQLYTPESVSVGNTPFGFEAVSWAKQIPPRHPGKIRVWAGSKTMRPYSGPWYVHCFYRQFIYRTGELHILGDIPKWKRTGLGDKVDWDLEHSPDPRFRRMHLVDGEHAFEVPPEAVIKTKVVYRELED
ncbi:MAG: hypothetical protein ABIJ93_04790 [candidate division WOR-3 bacterium]